MGKRLALAAAGVPLLVCLLAESAVAQGAVRKRPSGSPASKVPSECRAVRDYWSGPPQHSKSVLAAAFDALHGAPLERLGDEQLESLLRQAHNYSRAVAYTPGALPGAYSAWSVNLMEEADSLAELIHEEELRRLRRSIKTLTASSTACELVQSSARMDAAVRANREYYRARQRVVKALERGAKVEDGPYRAELAISVRLLVE